MDCPWDNEDTTTMNKREAKLEALFDQLLSALTDKMKSGDATAADLNVARQLCASLGIGANPKSHDGLQQFLDELPFDPDEAHS